MQLVDSHCHIDFSVFDEIRTEVLLDANQAGVTEIIVPGVTASAWPGLLALCQNPGFHPALGLHPCFLDQHQEADLDLLQQYLAQGSVCAVGEIGLDLFIEEPAIDRQLFFFRQQLLLARQYRLPVLLHVRKAHDQVLKVLRDVQLPRAGLVHAFSGSEQQAQQYLKLGFKLGVGGTVTYDRAKRFRRIVQQLPLESFVLETDAPDMPLSNYRGEINRPARVREVAEAVAELKNCSLEEIAQITTLNARQIYEPPIET